MEIEADIKESKELYSSISDFFKSEEDYDDKFCTLTKVIENQEILKNQNKFIKLLRLLYCIGYNYHRTAVLFNKLNTIFLYLKKRGSFPISDEEIFEIYKNSRFLLLILFENKFINPSESILAQIIDNHELCYYLYSEIKKYFDVDTSKSLQNEITTKFEISIEDFEKKCKTGENDLYICSLIRQDSIIDFIKYVNQTNLPLNSTIKPNYFESNSFLVDKEVSLIEYACFFGSIQIIKYMQLNQVRLKRKIWLSAIHSNNADLIHFLEQNSIHPKDESYYECFCESIKCHHNDIAEYIQDNLLKRDIEIDAKNIQIYQNFSQYVVDNCNYHFIPDDVNIISMLNSDQTDFFLYQFLANIRNFTIPSSVDLLGNFSFSKCIFLSQITIPASVTSIGNYAFCRCISLKQIAIPSSVTSIGDFAFYECSSLSEIEIPSSVISIGSSIFRGCVSLSRISIPSSIKAINEYSFYRCLSLKKLNFLHRLKKLTIIRYVDAHR